MPLSGVPAAVRLAGASIVASAVSVGPAAATHAIVDLHVSEAVVVGPALDAVEIVTRRIEAALGGPSDAPPGAFRIAVCGPGGLPAEPETMAAESARIVRLLYDGAVAEAAEAALRVLAQVRSGCGGVGANAAGALHDAAAALSWASSRGGADPDVARSVARIVLAAWPETAPSTETFPPSVLRAYEALRPVSSELAAISAVAPGCEAAVAGRIADGLVHAPPGRATVGVRCPGAPSVRIEFAVEPGDEVSLDLSPVAVPVGISAETAAIGRLLAGIGRLRGASTVVAAGAAGDGGVRAVAWRAGEGGGIAEWSGGPREPGLEAVVAAADSARSAAGVEEPGPADDRAIGLVPWIAAPIAAAGVGLLGVGAWHLAAADERDAVADRAATPGDRERTTEQAGDLEISGWAMTAVGAAAVVGAAAWWIADALSDGGRDGERPDVDVDVGALVAPGMFGFTVAVGWE
ncbi:MAG: hypothetical protein QME96_05095 [Myxococcota bacterium]|nr:hypothetical protein [Myxococcota bacterium]